VITMHETFWTLLRDPAHWEFEIFLMLVFDGLLAGLLWPIVRKHWAHHIARDRAEVTAVHPRITRSAPINIETPAGICDGCGGVLRTIDGGSSICQGCGEIQHISLRRELVPLAKPPYGSGYATRLTAKELLLKELREDRIRVWGNRE